MFLRLQGDTLKYCCSGLQGPNEAWLETRAQLRGLPGQKDSGELLRITFYAILDNGIDSVMRKARSARDVSKREYAVLASAQDSSS